MLKFIAECFGYVMLFIYNIVQNYGVAIIIFTVFMKLLLLPLTLKQQKSLKKTQELQPLLQELQRKYGNDQQRFALEYQKLLKEKNLSMASGMGCTGCLLQLIQFPIILGLFYMMSSPLTYIKKLPEEEINKYKENLNTYYAEQAIETAKNQAQISGEELSSGDIAAYYSGDYISNIRYIELVLAKQEGLFNMDFLGINLGDIASQNRTDWTLYIIPVLCVLVTLISLKMSTAEMDNNKSKQEIKPNKEEKNLATTDDNEIPMPNMTVINMIMPFMTGYIAYIAPQGLGLYWTVNSILQLIQSSIFILIRKKQNKNETVIKNK